MLSWRFQITFEQQQPVLGVARKDFQCFVCEGFAVRRKTYVSVAICIAALSSCCSDPPPQKMQEGSEVSRAWAAVDPGWRMGCWTDSENHLLRLNHGRFRGRFGKSLYLDREGGSLALSRETTTTSERARKREAEEAPKW